MKVSVTSGKAAHAVHTVFLSIPHVDDVTSHLVNEWGKKEPQSIEVQAAE